MTRRAFISDFVPFLLFLFAALIKLLMSSSLGVLDIYQENYDQNIYHIIGREWLNGHLPYIELSDIKGPIIFLYYGLGSLITPHLLIGTAVIHAFTVATGFLYAYKSARLFISESWSLLVTSVYVCYFGSFAGNPSELAWCMQHIILYWLLKGDVYNNKIIYTYGAFVGIIVAMKFNLIAFFVPFGLLILFRANRDNEGKKIIKRSLIAMGGFISAILPFAVYFFLNDGLRDLCDEYFLTCTKYGACPLSESALFKNHVFLLGRLLPFPCSFIPSCILIAIGIFLMFGWIPVLQNKIGIKITLLLLGSFICSMLGSFLGPYSFYHYLYVLYPFIFLTLLSLAIRISIFGNKISNKYLITTSVLIISSILLVKICGGYYVKTHPRYGLIQQSKRNEAVAKFIGKDTFVCADPDCILFYSVCNRTPRIKHFVPQKIDGGLEMYNEELISYIKTKRPQYILGVVNKLDTVEKLISSSCLTYERVPFSEIGQPEPQGIELPNNATIVWRLQVTNK